MIKNRELGSSPLTRGKPPDLMPSHTVERLIPAHAGKTVMGVRRMSAIQAHPRSRGENICVHRGPHNG